MDFILDYITVNTFWSILFMVHALLAVALLGALTHQAAAVFAPPRARVRMTAHAVAAGTAAHSACMIWSSMRAVRIG